jgi:hypothetical protein
MYDFDRYNRDLNLFLLTDKPPARSPEQARSRMRRLAGVRGRRVKRRNFVATSRVSCSFCRAVLRLAPTAGADGARTPVGVSHAIPGRRRQS